MKFARTQQFNDDLNKLEESDKIAVRNAFNDVVSALEGDAGLRHHHRIKKMWGTQDIWEGHVKQNLCFTFHFANNPEGEKVCFFRRIGTHNIYNKP